MEYIILDKNVIIDDIEYGTFVNIVEINDNHIKVNISNTEIYCNVPLSGIGIEQSIITYFNNEVKQNG